MSSTGLNPAGDVIDRVAGGVWNASSFSIYKIPITYTFIDAHAMIMEGLIYDYNLAWEAPGKRRKNAFLSEAVQGLKLTDLLWSWESHLNNTRPPMEGIWRGANKWHIKSVFGPPPSSQDCSPCFLRSTSTKMERLGDQDQTGWKVVPPKKLIWRYLMVSDGIWCHLTVTYLEIRCNFYLTLSDAIWRLVPRESKDSRDRQGPIRCYLTLSDGLSFQMVVVPCIWWYLTLSDGMFWMAPGDDIWRYLTVCLDSIPHMPGLFNAFWNTHQQITCGEHPRLPMNHWKQFLKAAIIL